MLCKLHSSEGSSAEDCQDIQVRNFNPVFGALAVFASLVDLALNDMLQRSDGFFKLDEGKSKGGKTNIQSATCIDEREKRMRERGSRRGKVASL